MVSKSNDASTLGSARSATAITPSATDLTSPFGRAIWVGTGGTIVCTLVDDTTASTFSNVPSGVLLPVSVKNVGTATTASGLVNVL